jgi:xylulokinase
LTPDLLVGVDIGSSSCKAVAVEPDGKLVGEGLSPYPTDRSQPGRAEQDPRHWHQAAVAAIRACLEGLAGERVAGIGIGGPAHNVAMAGDDGEPVAPTIHWSDLRSIPQCHRLETEFGDRVFDITLQRVNPLWTLPQLMWMKENRTDVWAGVCRIQVVKDFVRSRLTGGGYVTDPYDATGTQLYDPRRGRWVVELLELIGFSPDRMPAVRDPGEVAGELDRQAAADLGLRTGTPVVVGSGDSVLEALAIGTVEPGDSLVKLASSGTVIAVAETPLPSREIQTYPHVVPGRWIGLAGTNSGAGTLQWLAEGLLDGGPGTSIDALVAAAAAAPPGSDGLLFHPYVAGGRSPQWNPLMRGHLSGISEGHGREHLVRATLEGVVFALRHAAEAADAAGHRRTNLRLIGGGAASDLWARIVAEVFAMPVERILGSAPGYGAALIAGMGAGVLSDRDLAARHLPPADRIIPDPERSDAYQSLFRVFVERAEEIDRNSRPAGETSSR